MTICLFFVISGVVGVLLNYHILAAKIRIKLMCINDEFDTRDTNSKKKKDFNRKCCK